MDKYWGSKVLGHNTHQHLLDSVHESLKVIDIAKMVQQMVDGWTKCKLDVFEETERREKKNLDLLDWSTLVAVIYASFTVPSNPVSRQVDGIWKNWWSSPSSF